MCKFAKRAALVAECVLLAILVYVLVTFLIAIGWGVCMAIEYL